VPFTSVSENTEVVLKSSAAGAIFEMGKEGLRAKQLTWEIFVDEDIVGKRGNISSIIDGFPGGSSNIKDLKSACNSSEGDGVLETTNAEWVAVTELGCGRVSASAINNSAEYMSVVVGGLVEYFSGCSNDQGKIFGVEFLSAKGSLIRPIFS